MMTKEQACVAYDKVVDLLFGIIDSGHRGTKEDILEELKDDLED